MNEWLLYNIFIFVSFYCTRVHGLLILQPIFNMRLFDFRHETLDFACNVLNVNYI